MKIRFFGYTLERLDLCFESMPEDLAGDIIECGQMKKCILGQGYTIINGDTNEDIPMPAVSEEEFEHYYDIFDTIFQTSILPEKGGTNDQLPWVIPLFKAFKRGYENTQVALELKAMKSSKGK